MRSLIVVMGVSGSGKSTVGVRLALRLGVPFCEGDELHPAANVAKMASGHALDDDDRAPWLDAINRWMRDRQDGGVISCSALRRSHRDRLRRDLAIVPTFVLLDPPVTRLVHRLAARRGHFFPATLLYSQLATLERPTSDERALQVVGEGDADSAVDEIVDLLDTGSAISA